MPKKTAVVVFNLGGPDNQDSVEPFLFNLFNDKAIIRLPQPLRFALAKLISKRRAPIAREIYQQMGGGSPIVPQTMEQAKSLEAALGEGFKVFVVMRYWHPRADEVAASVKAWGADAVILLPLYPQFSTTTTESSFADWERAAKAAGLKAPERRICCYPNDSGFVKAYQSLVKAKLKERSSGAPVRLLFSAHGLPEKIALAGDPYQSQVEFGVKAIMEDPDLSGLDFNVCYQSRVGPLKWIGPSTDDEIKRAGNDGMAVMIVPIAFVSEHSETLVELDIEYRHLAAEVGVPEYMRVETVGTELQFIEGLRDIVLRKPAGSLVSCGSDFLCRGASRCPLHVSE